MMPLFRDFTVQIYCAYILCDDDCDGDCIRYVCTRVCLCALDRARAHKSPIAPDRKCGTVFGVVEEMEMMVTV